MLKLVTGDEQNWVWKGKRRHFGTMLPRRWEIRKMEEVAQAEIFLQFIFHSPRFWGVQCTLCTDFIAGVKRPFMPRDPSWIFCLWEHPSSRHLLYYGEPSPSQLNEIKINQRYEKSSSPKTISAAEVLRLMVYGRVYSQWHSSLNHSSGLIVPQISRYRQSGWLEVLLGEHCEKAGGRNRALRRFRRLIPTAIEASRPCKCKYGGEVIFLI